jgi:hypothetical protein
MFIYILYGWSKFKITHFNQNLYASHFRKEEVQPIWQSDDFFCLLNVCFNFFTKAGTNRIMGIAPRVIRRGGHSA